MHILKFRIWIKKKYFTFKIKYHYKHKHILASNSRGRRLFRRWTSSTVPGWTRTPAGICRTWGRSSTRRLCLLRRRPLPYRRLLAARTPIPTKRRGHPGWRRPAYNNLLLAFFFIFARREDWEYYFMTYWSMIITIFWEHAESVNFEIVLPQLI